MIGTIAEHMDYAALIKWMITCKKFNSYCWATWRGQALLLRTPTFGTQANFCTVFRRHTQRFFEDTLWAGTCPIDIGLNIVYSYITTRTVPRCIVLNALAGYEYAPLVQSTEPADRLERARDVMRNAMDMYKENFDTYGEWDAEGFHPPVISTRDYDDEESEYDQQARYQVGCMRMLSAMCSPVQVEVLLPKTGMKFKTVLARMMKGYCVPWIGAAAKYTPGTNFMDGEWHESDDRPVVDDENQAADPVEAFPANDAPAIQNQMAALFGPENVDDEAVEA